jgi:ATP-dependent Clp protease ATP-binding subunit ClpC
MFEYFNEKAIKAVMFAQEEARRTGHSVVGTEHLLLG